MIVEQSDPEGRLALWLGDLDSDGPLQRLTPENVAEGAGDISPDGQWLAYMSDTAGEMAVFVRRLDGSGAIRISPGGGTQPAWRSDGRELFYVDALGRLIAVPITPGAGLRPGAPTVLFDARLEEASDRQYDVSADGQRFLLNRRVAADDAPLVVVLDWSALIDSKSP